MPEYAAVPDTDEEEATLIAQEASSVTEQLDASEEPYRLSGGFRKAAGLLVSAAAAIAIVQTPSMIAKISAGATAEGKASTAASLAAASRVSSTAMDGFTPTLNLENDHSRKTGRKIGDGLYRTMKHLAQVHKATTLSLDSKTPVIWTVDGVVLSEEPSTEIEYTFTEIGKHTVGAGDVEFTVHSKAVRYEIRDLTDDDREGYFHALHTLYTISQKEGVDTYGANYKGSDYLVREHIEGAADIMCDHWHDDAGVMNHHIAITWQMEQSLRMIDPSTAAHYWDYTIDATGGWEWYDSVVFDDDWYGSNSPNNGNHVIDTGRWAYTKVKTDAWDYSNITNPYGLLRSPWNTNPVPYVLRSNHTLGSFGDNYKSLPACASFAAYLGSSLAQVLNALNGELHGPVHIMIGGQWDMKYDWKGYMEDMGFADNFLLLGKDLWRQGFLRVPTLCSADTPHADCMSSCPDEYKNGLNSSEIIAKTGLKFDSADTTWLTALSTYGKDVDMLLEEICHLGSPGEMFTSAAPQDPTFWPLHGNAERFVQYLRTMKENGNITMDESWEYYHMSNIPSDDHLVCDWTGVKEDSLDMPDCYHDTCPGHKEDDLLPFTGLTTSQDGLYTNLGFYKLTNPDNDELPYVYSSLSHWAGCTDDSLWTEYELTESAKGGGQPAEMPSDAPADAPAPGAPATPVMATSGQNSGMGR